MGSSPAVSAHSFRNPSSGRRNREANRFASASSPFLYPVAWPS